MKEIYANLWEVEADLRVVTTNGAVRRDGACVMGRGCAREAKERYPGVEYRLGSSSRSTATGSCASDATGVSGRRWRAWKLAMLP